MTAASRLYVLFDLDGTLVDTRDAVESTYRMVFSEELGQNFPPANLPGELFAMRPREVFATQAPDRVDHLYDAYQRAYPKNLQKVKVFDGAAGLIKALHAAGRKPGLVTNKGVERTHSDLKVAGINPEDLSVIITAEDTVERKPHPAPINLALKRLGVSADQVIYVGDGPQDILAARAAGMGCIALTYGFYSQGDLEALNPERLAKDVYELATVLGLDLAEGAGS